MAQNGLLFLRGIDMAQIGTNELRGGMNLEIDKEPFVVVSNDFVKPGKGQPFNRVKLKHLLTGKVVERTYKSGEKLDLADVEERRMRMLYKDSDGIAFMEDETYEQLSVPLSVISDKEVWMKEDVVYDLIFYKGAVVDVAPPTFMEMTIVDTPPGVRGDTASGRVLKPATTETGAKIQVPIFVEEGEKIKVDTRTGEYVSRV